MDTRIAMPTQIVVDIEDRTMLRSLKMIIKQLKGVVAVKEVAPKTIYSEKEFIAKIERSKKSAEGGRVFSQAEGESINDFIDRLLCIE